MRRLIAFVIIAASALHAQQKMYSTWDFPAITAPGTTGLSSGWYRFYFKTGTGFCFKDSGGTETCPGVGGVGITTMTTGAADPTANCTAPSSSNIAKYYNTVAKTLWSCVDTNTWRRDINVDPAAAWLIVGNTGSAPANPSSNTVALYSLADGKLYARNSTGVVTSTVTASQNVRDIPILFDASGVALTGPRTACRMVDYGGTITKYTALADTSGGATVVIKTGSYASYTGPASITTDISNGGEVLSSAVKMQDATLTGWTTAFNAGDVLCATLSSPSSIAWLSVVLTVKAD